MKNFIVKFRLSVRFVVSIITSREFAFIYCCLGTIAQIAHTFYLIENISSLDGFWKTTQAFLLAFFISSSLLYFTAIATDEDSDESRKIHRTITLFTIIEILINLYYYTRSLIITSDNPSNNIFDYIFAVLISCLIPVTIKLYSSHIRAKEWFDEFGDGSNDAEVLPIVEIAEEIEEDEEEIEEEIEEENVITTEAIKEEIFESPIIKDILMTQEEKELITQEIDEKIEKMRATLADEMQSSIQKSVIDTMANSTNELALIMAKINDERTKLDEKLIEIKDEINKHTKIVFESHKQNLS